MCRSVEEEDGVAFHDKVSFDDFQGDTIRVLWSLHDNDPELNMAAHHRKRGGRALRLKTAAAHSPPPPPQTRNKLQHWDVKLNQVKEILSLIT